MPARITMLIAGRYRVEHVLGSGGMGTVHAGADTLLKRRVAHLAAAIAASAGGRSDADDLFAEALDPYSAIPSLPLAGGGAAVVGKARERVR